MGKTNQEQIRRKIAQAMLNTTKAVRDLQEVEAKFAGTHDDMADFLKVICVGLDTACDAIEQFSIMAWGRVPDNWENWRNGKSRRQAVLDAKTNG